MRTRTSKSSAADDDGMQQDCTNAFKTLDKMGTAPRSTNASRHWDASTWAQLFSRNTRAPRYCASESVLVMSRIADCTLTTNGGIRDTNDTSSLKKLGPGVADDAVADADGPAFRLAAHSSSLLCLRMDCENTALAARKMGCRTCS